MIDAKFINSLCSIIHAPMFQVRNQLAELFRILCCQRVSVAGWHDRHNGSIEQEADNEQQDGQQ